MGVIVINNSYKNVEDNIAGKVLSNIEGESLKQNDTNGVTSRMIMIERFNILLDEIYKRTMEDLCRDNETSRESVPNFREYMKIESDEKCISNIITFFFLFDTKIIYTLRIF